MVLSLLCYLFCLRIYVQYIIAAAKIQKYFHIHIEALLQYLQVPFLTNVRLRISDNSGLLSVR